VGSPPKKFMRVLRNKESLGSWTSGVFFGSVGRQGGPGKGRPEYAEKNEDGEKGGPEKGSCGPLRYTLNWGQGIQETEVARCRGR